MRPRPAIQMHVWPCGFPGRSGGTRTHGPRFWRPMLYQLSYTPPGGSASSHRAFAWQATRIKGSPMHAPAPRIIPPELLLTAYRSGIFPMADSRDDDDIYWVEPRERGIIPLDGFRCSRSLAKAIARERFRVTCNADFESVVEACA